MQLNQSITAYDLALALEGETGRFLATSPQGTQFVVECQIGHSISSVRAAPSEATPKQQKWVIRKIAEIEPQE